MKHTLFISVLMLVFVGCQNAPATKKSQQSHDVVSPAVTYDKLMSKMDRYDAKKQCWVKMNVAVLIPKHEAQLTQCVASVSFFKDVKNNLYRRGNTCERMPGSYTWMTFKAAQMVVGGPPGNQPICQ